MRVNSQPDLYHRRWVSPRPVEVVPTRSSDDLPSHYPAGVSGADQYPAERVYVGELLRPTAPVGTMETPRVAPPVYATAAVTPDTTAVSDLRNRAVAAYVGNSLRPDLMARRTGQVVDEFA
jgi:hypothetical protein